MATANSTVPINGLMFNAGPADYYDDGFRQVLEDHMAWLRTHQSTQVSSVSAQDVWENEQDLFGYLQSVRNMAPQFHWITMRLNNLTSPDQFTGNVGALLIPSIMLMEQLRNAWNTTSVMNT